jgi:hypothetical protein
MALGDRFVTTCPSPSGTIINRKSERQRSAHLVVALACNKCRMYVLQSSVIYADCVLYCEMLEMWYVCWTQGRFCTP